MSLAPLNIEVAYALPRQQVIIPLQVVAGTTLQQAIEQSGILQQFPEIDLTQQAIGIFSKRASLTDICKEGDRIEIYRPLLIDPKEARHKRAKKLSF